MGDWHDYVALEWVKGEIAETLKQARQALEAYVENPQDLTRMRFCLTYLHQVHGTLQMVEFFGAALLAEEMEHLAQAMIEGRIANRNEALEVLMQAILQMPAYLERVQEARRDLPMAILPLLNDLRSARGEALLSETSLFSPDLSSRPAMLSPDALASLHSGDLPVLLRKLRQMQQQALVGIIRNQDLATNLGYMARVFARLESLCKDAPLGQLWQISSGLIEGLAEGCVSNGASVRGLLRQVDKELKRFIEQGSVGVNQEAPSELIKNLLFYVAKAETLSPRINALKARFKLDLALPDSGQVEDEQARLAGPDRDAMRSVVTALCEELVRVKDSLDLFVRSDRQTFSDLEPMLAPLKQIGDTLAVLGFAQPRKVILDQWELLHKMSRGEQQSSDALLMDIAGALLYVEATLAGMAGPAESGKDEDSLVPTTDVAQIHQVVIKEARNGLEQAKDAIVEFIASQWNHEHLERVPALLSQVRGGLAMIPLPRAAALLGAATRYIEEQLLVRKMVPNWQSLDTLADAITGIEYYLERVAEDRIEQGEQILNVAEDSLDSLGYPLQEKPSILDWPDTQEALPVPSSDPLQEIDVLAAELPESVVDEEDQAIAEMAVEDFAEDLHAVDVVWSEIQEDTLPVEPELQVDYFSENPSVETADLGDDDDLLDEIELQDIREDSAPSGEGAVVEHDFSDELLVDDDNQPLAEWDAEDLAELDLPEVELPEPVELAETAPAEKPLSVADVMAQPVQAINPPAQNVPQSLLPPPADEEPVDEDLLEVFVEEAGEVLETLGEYLPQWFADTESKEALAEIRRAFHTLKGSGRMVRALVIGELSWSIENMLNRVLDRSIVPDTDVQQSIADVFALLPELVSEYAAKAQRQRDDVDLLAARAHALALGQKLAMPESEPEVENETAGAAAPQAQDTSETVAVELIDAQLLEIFLTEAQSHLETLQAFLADCARELPLPVTDNLQRALHTLKGSAYMAGILPIAEIAAPLEKLAKDYKAHLIDIDLAEVELLREATQLFRKGLDQLETTPLQSVAGAADFLERLGALYEERLTVQASQFQEEGSARDPQLIGIFLAQGMDILLDAEALLKHWHANPSERRELDGLLEELATLGRGAQMAELPQIDALCQCLLQCYAAVQAGQLQANATFFAEIEAAHESLISMMDQLAAGLEVKPQTAQIAALNELMNQAVSAQAPNPVEPENSELPGLVDVVEEQPADEPVEFVPDSVSPAEEIQELEVAEVDDLQELDDEMVEIFLEEAIELVEESSHCLEKWIDDNDNTQALAALLRDLHTLKGGALMAGIRPIGDLAHEMETLYEGLVDGRYLATAELSGLLHQGHDRLAVMVEQMQLRQPLVSPSELISSLASFGRGISHAFAQDEAGEQILPEPLTPAATEPVPGTDESHEYDLGDLSIAELQLPDLEMPESPASEHAGEAPEDFAEEEVTEMPALTDAEWSMEEALPQLGAQPLEIPAIQASEEPLSFDAAADSGLVTEALPDNIPTEAADPELVEIFLEEGFDIIESSSASLQNWMQNVDNSLELESLQRDLHTLKGGARMAEIREIGDLAHELEFLYEGLGNGKLKAASDLFVLLQSCHDCLADMLEAVRDQAPMPSGALLIQAIRGLLADPGSQLQMPTSVHLQPVEQENVDGPESDILDIFLEEADDLLETVEAALGSWEAARDDLEPLGKIQRTLHNLKGGARLAGQSRLGDLANDLEQYLGDIQLQGQPWPESMFADVQSAFDGLKAELEQLRQRISRSDEADAQARPVKSAQSEVLPLRKLDLPIVAVSTQPAATARQAEVLPFVRRAAEAAQEAEARRAPQELVKVPAELLEGLVNLAGETSIFRGRVEQQVSDVGYTLGEMEATIERVRDQLRRLDTETQAQILSRYQSEAERSGYEEFDLLEMDRHSQLQQLSRALFESASDLLDLKETLAVKNRDAETLLLQQARVNTELQEGLMRTRMVPFDRLVPRLRRIVRQISGELGKQVEFNVANAEGEMDRTVLERIVAPLEHMLRNAVDHGIESAATRQAAGKPEVGTITLGLGREGGDILLTLADDGGGIQLAAVRRKAIERGMMTADADLSDQEILQFILEAGFSTAEKITQISGRGVGMDVVHSEVKQLGGSMRIESAVGEGTRFLIRLPFTVSVNRALMVLSGEDLYAIPLNTIEGIVRVSPFELEALYQREVGQTEAARFEYAGQTYDLKYLGDLLNNEQHPKLVGQSLPLPVILVRSAEHAMAVQVDSLAGSREIVVKSLGRQFSSVHGISGATILGDGRVVVILDLLATIRSLHALDQFQLRRSALQKQLQEESDHTRPTLVMVVDDSVTVRKVTTRLLERAGMNAITAKDGVDALTQLQEHHPDVILLDVEMPRMDGFEVATLVRHDERMKDLPIIMITSRTGEKHRQRAMAIGVNEYLGKPYQESLLLETINRLVKVKAND
ncbi:chemosensory pili system protein ChpA (sensor histidine kinase/response regulator) [Pseudomonas pohangensis]|uniref:Chemotaxis protein CheA n=1 Tax=Pseudomonas pohangensis TaxID=364197 RepID=A0A1H2HIJ9_9PSED|nr:Hpt domain-containing protein [Pseudomonas pohangensis]SDU31701.1 chemosensory pili system protein ChpA (sensor histidine kinase/response regulator) [Pseudomonas pohangensis]